MQKKVLVRIFRNREVFDFYNIEDIPDLIHDSIRKVFNIENILKITIHFDEECHGGIAVGVVEFDGNVITKWMCIPDGISQLASMDKWEVCGIW